MQELQERINLLKIFEFIRLFCRSVLVPVTTCFEKQ